MRTGILRSIKTHGIPPTIAINIKIKVLSILSMPPFIFPTIAEKMQNK